MIPQKVRAPRYIGKRTSKRIKKAIRKKYPTIKALAEEIGEKPQFVYNVINGLTCSRRVATKIEKAVGQKLFPYTTGE